MVIFTFHQTSRSCLRQPPLYESWKASVIIAFGIGNCSQPWCHSRALSQLMECTLSHTRAHGKVLGHKLRNLHLVEIVHDPLSTPWVVNPLVLCFFALFFSALSRILLDHFGYCFTMPFHLHIGVVADHGQQQITNITSSLHFFPKCLNCFPRWLDL